MAHAVYILFDQDRASMVNEVLNKTDHIVEHRLRNRKIEPEIEEALLQRDAFFAEEKPAVAVEEQISREMIDRIKKRKTPNTDAAPIRTGR